MAKPLVVKDCQSCHSKIYYSWLKSKHTQAARSLSLDEQRNLSCRACHDDVGLRILIQSQLSAEYDNVHPEDKFNFNQKRRASTKKTQAHERGVDCFSCHSLVHQQSKQQHLEWHTLSKQKMTSKRKSLKIKSLTNVYCNRCHSLPPLKGINATCIDPHSLKANLTKNCPKK